MKKLLLFTLFLLVGIYSVQADTNCWNYNDETSCSANSCTWETDSWGSWCEGLSCFSGDETNQTYCETTLNETYGFDCGWETHGTGLCDPIGGNSFGDGCADFDNDQQGCYSTNWCIWNSTESTCDEPEGGFVAGPSPSCLVVGDQTTCLNITGCSWDGSSCTGNNQGISCSDLGKSICADFTMLSSCCSWNGTTCGTSFKQECYNSMPAQPIGATYCEDYNAYKNQTLCNQIAGSPWYMPCKWNNVTSVCGFNSQAFGGSSTFDEITTKKGCEAQSGTWKTEQWTDNSGSGSSVKTDSWCEFNYGSGGNCDASCWACENDAGVTSVSTAESVCEGSELGYCDFQQDSNAQNSYGWCNPKQDFIQGGGKSCSDDCASCEYLTNPQTQCTNSPKGCSWQADTSAQNGVGFCYGKNDKYCDNDCFSCYSETDCSAGDGGNGACNWNNVKNFCQPSGFNGEVCFDGVDNDNNGKVDCADAGCSTDKFCGGGALSSFYGDCPSFTSQGNNTCISNGCVWITDDFDQQYGGAGAGWCDFPGAQCWELDSDQTTCNNEPGCSYISGGAGFCEENETRIDNCFVNQNQSSCQANEQCGWISNGEFGFCDTVPLVQCEHNLSRQASQAACEGNVTIDGTSTQICGWQEFAPPGHKCNILCFTKDAGSCGGGTNGFCEVVSGLCEPESFGGKCFVADGNKSQCIGDLNSTCSWYDDTQANNNVSASETSGWCDPVGDSSYINYFGEQKVEIFGNDGDDVGIDNSYDIAEIGLKDDFDKIIFGINLVDGFEQSGTCNGVPTYNTGTPGSGELNYTFLWYIDADGNAGNGCSARDDAAQTGYEFSFKYQSNHDGTSLSEKKISYQCVNGAWGAVPIPLIAVDNIMCDLIGGGMAGLDKQEMYKFKSLYNKTANLRIYVSVGNGTSNDSSVVDTAGPYYYSPGSFDHKFEDCSNPGGDADGDGLVSSNDPDCFDYLKFGYVPNEAGFQCGDDIDNDADGKIDCDDEGCAYDSFYCSGSLVPDANDKTAPKIKWFSVNTYPDAAFVMFDTNEPSNGTVQFYDTDSSCKTLNSTIKDVGLLDPSVPSYKLWHDTPVDNSGYNQQALGFNLVNATTYYLKTKVCDVSGNCAVSSCTNFTTRTSFASCKGCSTTFNFPFTPKSGDVATDPLGNIKFKFQLPDGSDVNLDGNSAAGKQFNYSQTKNFNLEIENPNSTTQWKIKLINASVNGKLSSEIQNFSAGSDVGFNATSNGTFVGLGSAKCQQLINTFRPKKLEMGIPGNNSELWQCDHSLSGCIDKTSNATRVGYNSTSNMTFWQVPAEWGC